MYMYCGEKISFKSGVVSYLIHMDYFEPLM
jgi:hypothetical protein